MQVIKKPQPHIIFAGTPAFALTALRALILNNYPVAMVYTQPDRKSGRGQQLLLSPVKEYALTQNLPIHQPLSLKSAEEEKFLRDLEPDLMIVAAYGLILPQAILDIPRLGCINIHASLLPRWRGASPIQQAIRAGDTLTGISLMQMSAGLDEGPILQQSICPIPKHLDATILSQQLAQCGAHLLIQALPAILNGRIRQQSQESSHATYAPKITKLDAQIDWRKPAHELECCVRAYHGWPVAYATLNTQTIRVWQASFIPQNHSYQPGQILQATAEGILVACGSDALRLEVIQLPGKRAMHVKELLNSYQSLFNTQYIFAT